MKDDQVYVAHIFECVAKVRRYAAAGEQAFYSDELLQDGIMRTLQIMAESTQRLSDGLKARHPEIPWVDIGDFRNVLVHQYLSGINLKIVWNVIHRDLPELEKALSAERTTP